MDLVQKAEKSKGLIRAEANLLKAMNADKEYLKSIGKVKGVVMVAFTDIGMTFGNNFPEAVHPKILAEAGRCLPGLFSRLILAAMTGNLVNTPEKKKSAKKKK